MQPGTAGWAQLCPSARDEAAAVARQASQLAETAAELAAAQVVVMTHRLSCKCHNHWRFRQRKNLSNCQRWSFTGDIALYVHALHNHAPLHRLILHVTALASLLLLLMRTVGIR